MHVQTLQNIRNPKRCQGTALHIMNEQAQIKETVRQFISSSINLADWKEDENLFDLGLVNSLFAVQLMTFIEKTFAIEVGPEDLDIENFKSLNAMTAFVLQKNRHAHAATAN
jgi:methoxymalonate biosynthesis acyl carrier protein